MPSNRPSTSVVAVERERDRLAHALVLERLLVDAHVHCRCADDCSSMIVTFGSLSSACRRPTENCVDHVDLAALQRQDLRLLVGVEGECRSRSGSAFVPQ